MDAKEWKAHQHLEDAQTDLLSLEQDMFNMTLADATSAHPHLLPSGTFPPSTSLPVSTTTEQSHHLLSSTSPLPTSPPASAITEQVPTQTSSHVNPTTPMKDFPEVSLAEEIFHDLNRIDITMHHCKSEVEKVMKEWSQEDGFPLHMASRFSLRWQAIAFLEGEKAWFRDTTARIQAAHMARDLTNALF